jgi:hypothetical protein
MFRVFVTGIMFLHAILSKSEEKVGEIGTRNGNGDHVVNIGRRRKKIKTPPQPTALSHLTTTLFFHQTHPLSPSL